MAISKGVSAGAHGVSAGAASLGASGKRGSGAALWYEDGSDLARSIVGMWKMDEASGTRAASVGSIPLLDGSLVGSAAGIIHPLAANFSIPSTDYLRAADSVALSTGDIVFWGAVLIRPTAVDVISCIVGKWHTSGNREWQLAQSGPDIVFQVSPNGTATGNGAVTLAGVLAANTDAWIVWYHDSVNDLLGLSVNGSAFTTVAYDGGVWDSLAELNVGRQSSGAAYFGGLVQELVFGKGYVPVHADAVDYYNRGVNNGVESVHLIGYGGEGEFSHDGLKIVFDRRDENDIYQVFVSNPDGSGEQCLSVPAVVGGPTITRHKGFPSWHSSNDYIVMQVEMAVHNSDTVENKYLSEPGRGHHCDVWVCSADGQQWWQLTSYSGVDPEGVLNPRFSPDGTKLLWAKKIGGITEPAPFGTWNLQLADFAIVDGTPTLSNVTTLTPGSGTFYESHGFNLDGTKILFTSDIGLASPYGLDVFLYTIGDATLVNLTNSGTQWDEHAAYGPPGVEKVAYMSTRPYPTFIAANVPIVGLTQLKSETFVMTSTGTNPRQVTHFNVSGFAESNEERSVAAVCSWHPTGRYLLVSQILLEESYDAYVGRLLWMVKFNGFYT